MSADSRLTEHGSRRSRARISSLLGVARACRVSATEAAVAASSTAGGALRPVIWDLAGHLPLPLAVLGHVGSTVIVGLNGLRLLRKSAWARALRA
jgi:cation-transporting P-type ATPase J